VIPWWPFSTTTTDVVIISKEKRKENLIITFLSMIRQNHLDDGQSLFSHLMGEISSVFIDFLLLLLLRGVFWLSCPSVGGCKCVADDTIRRYPKRKLCVFPSPLLSPTIFSYQRRLAGMDGKGEFADQRDLIDPSKERERGTAVCVWTESVESLFVSLAIDSNQFPSSLFFHGVHQIFFWRADDDDDP
jgi:hypothetical protein